MREEISKIEGRAWLLGDNVDTDQIVPGRYLTYLDYEEMAQHALEGFRRDFTKEVREGDVIVAGGNFGGGSSREEAPQVLRTLGIRCIIAESVSRLFYRNAFNIGLPVIVLEDAASKIADGDVLSVDLIEGTVIDQTKNKTFHADPVPQHMLDLIREGGAIKKYQREMTRKR